MSFAYSPVEAFEIDKEAVSSTIRGYAAPIGQVPSIVKLTADNVPIAYARATAYSPAAASAGLRGGWCGFNIAGVGQAFAISDDVKLTCGTSGKVLFDVPVAGLISRSPPSASPCSSRDVISLVRRADCCPSPGHLAVFALNHYRRHGGRAFVEAVYQTLLGRWPDDSAPAFDLSGETIEGCVDDYLESILTSPEFLSKSHGLMPGPYHQAFRFDATGII